MVVSRKREAVVGRGCVLRVKLVGEKEAAEEARRGSSGNGKRASERASEREGWIDR